MKLIKTYKSKIGAAKIYKSDDGEFITKLYNADGKYLIDCDSFTDDCLDAHLTAQNALENLKPARTDDFVNESLIGRRVRFNTWTRDGVHNNVVRVVKAVHPADAPNREPGRQACVEVRFQGIGDFLVRADEIVEVMPDKEVDDVVVEAPVDPVKSGCVATCYFVDEKGRQTDVVAGYLNFYSFAPGYKFNPKISGRNISRIFHKTRNAAVPAWVRRGIAKNRFVFVEKFVESKERPEMAETPVKGAVSELREFLSPLVDAVPCIDDNMVDDRLVGKRVVFDALTMEGKVKECLRIVREWYVDENGKKFVKVLISGNFYKVPASAIKNIYAPDLADDLAPEIIAFQTGRHYSPFGQRILAVKFQDGVIFSDLDRKLVQFIENCPLEKGAIMRAYDRCNYGAWSENQKEIRNMIDPSKRETIHIFQAKFKTIL